MTHSATHQFAAPPVPLPELMPLPVSHPHWEHLSEPTKKLIETVLNVSHRARNLAIAYQTLQAENEQLRATLHLLTARYPASLL